MSAEERLALIQVWNRLVVFVALLYLRGGFFKAALIAGFVLISGLLGFGRRWLHRIGFATAVLALAVVLGFPHPDQWADLARATPHMLQEARTFLASLP